VGSEPFVTRSQAYVRKTFRSSLALTQGIEQITGSIKRVLVLKLYDTLWLRKLELQGVLGVIQSPLFRQLPIAQAFL
jgi:hypothetical protein